MSGWFRGSFREPTAAQVRGWPPIVEGRSTLLLAPTGSGKTLAAFLASIDRLLLSPEPDRLARCRVLYVSPLKALAFDVERNLRAPVAGIAAVAERRGDAYRALEIAIRTGDTPAAERARLSRSPPDILITTPESLYLLLTSAARKILAAVETVIVDEIHSIAPTKRGSHLALSLERLEALRPRDARPLQRIGLSATQRPLDEMARLLGGGEVTASGAWRPRDVVVVDAGRKKRLDLRVEVPLEDLRFGGAGDPDSPSAPSGPRSIWPALYPRLVDLIRRHRSTMVFVNSRRLAERLAAALNETAGEEIALAHHGSVARDQRRAIEDRLKRGELPALVATSSMELGVDMGAMDLVVQVEAPPSVTSGLQRAGRAGHTVDAVSRAVILPKHRGDLLPCAAAVSAMDEGLVEETRYPRNPLDVLAQQLVALVSMAPATVDEAFALVRRAAPFAELSRSSFEGVLDMLSGKYPSDEFAELRPRITWDRVGGTLKAREGARRVAVINGGTIPDRGLYGVFLAEEGAERRRGSRRVGELDEEMVFECREGDVFVLGASSWRIQDITHDRVVVAPAPGQPGKMPFWHGDRPGRPLELGLRIGRLVRDLMGLPRAEAARRLRTVHRLDAKAAANLLAYLSEQRDAVGAAPDDRTIVVERFVDEVGDWRVCVLSPFGARVHAPWATAALARLKEASDAEIETLWSDDGLVFRLPESGEAPSASLFFPPSEEVEELVSRSLGQTALFAARFRENAARALLLPRRYPGRRSPLWAQRKRSRDLLAVAARYGSFPILLETYRDCLQDVFDLRGLVEILRGIEQRRIRVITVDSRAPSPFAASILFSYVANFIYDGDMPLAERRAQALTVDPVQLRELLGEAVLRELLDPAVIAELESSLQRLDGTRLVAHADALHDLLLALGDLSRAEIRSRSARPEEAERWIRSLQRDRRIVSFRVGRTVRLAAVEDASRYRDAIGVVLPQGLPQSLLEPVEDPLGDLVSRYARTHGPFTEDAVAERFGIGVAPIRAALRRLLESDRVVEGELLPGGRGREWCDVDVLRTLKRRSLAALRKEVEPVEQAALARFSAQWQGLARRRKGPDGLLAVIEQLQGCPLVASVLESEILPARVEDYRPEDLDLLCATGSVVWRGIEPVGTQDGRIALYLSEHAATLAPPPAEIEGELARKVVSILESRGASFYRELHAEIGAFARDIIDALWSLVWSGAVTNDTFAPLRSLLRRGSSRGGRRARERRPPVPGAGPPGSEGRWSLPRAARDSGEAASATARQAARVRVLLERYGVLTREALAAEMLEGGFSGAYPVLKAMEEAGRVRRGYFVEGLGATQFALPGAEEALRGARSPSDEPRTLLLSATDPANPYGAALAWPPCDGTRLERRAGAQVILRDGVLVGYLARTEGQVGTLLPPAEPARADAARSLARTLASLADAPGRGAFLISRIDGGDPAASPLAPYLLESGFTAGSRGYLRRRADRSPPMP